MKYNTVIKGAVLVNPVGLHRDQRDDRVTQGLAERTHVLSVLQVYDQLCMQTIPSGVLHSLKVPANRQKGMKM